MLIINILKVKLKRNVHRFDMADIHVHTVLYIHVYMGTKHCTSLKVLVVSIGLVCLSLVKVRLSKGVFRNYRQGGPGLKQGGPVKIFQDSRGGR